MARYHYWQFIVNQEGQPINNVKINLYLAGTNTPAHVYSSEFGGSATNELPQTYTNQAGYFEFWLGDHEEADGYPIGQKFKLNWERENITSGSIDWIDVFPGFAPVDETDDEDSTKNKLVSNTLAYGWQQHIQHQDVTTTAKPTFRQIRVTEDPFTDQDIITKGYLDDRIIGLSWQRPANMFWNPNDGDPPSKTEGDRYIASATGTVDGETWTENNIYDWNVYEGENNWVEVVPFNGYSLLVQDEDRHYTYNADISEWVKFSAGWAWYVVSSDTYMENRNGYLVDCSSGPVTLQFPSSPEPGARVDILDYTYSSETHNITLSGNGEPVEDNTSFVIDVNGAGLQFVYTDATYGWKMLNEVYSEDSLTKIFEEYHEIADTDSGWTVDGSDYYITISHERGSGWPSVTVYDTDTRILITPVQVKSIDSSTMRLWFNSQLNIMVKLS